MPTHSGDVPPHNGAPMWNCQTAPMVHAVSASFLDDGAQQPHSDARVTRHLRELFLRLPALQAFRLRNDLSVAEVSLVTRRDSEPAGRLRVRLMQALVELAECDLQAAALMRGGTFARKEP